MYNPTKWQQLKDLIRYVLCRHKHVQTRTVRGGTGDKMEVIGKFKYCLDCKNNISGWL